MASKNFFKQFDYLYKTSCAIIHEFGIRYFLRFGISQIKNQKLDLLKLKAEYESKSIPEKIIDKKTQYDLWIKKQKLHSSIDVEHFTLKPKICFIILLPKSITTLSIKNSIQSIFKQSYANWELLILTTKATYEQVQNLIISQSYDEQKIKTINGGNYEENFDFSYIFFTICQFNLGAIMDRGF